MWLFIKALASVAIIVAVSEIAPRFPRFGAVLLSLPIVSLLAFTWIWFGERNLVAVSRLARETLVLVPLGLPFFIPLAFCERLHLGFWTAFALGVGVATVTIVAWLYYAPANW